ncbi:MAG: PilZ domain-containing protein, partial [Candidatus Acidiferrales bacterium]
MAENKSLKIDHPADPETQERRGHARYPFTATAEVVGFGSDTRVQGRASDLSRMGCYVDTINPLSPGAVVTMRLSKKTDIFEARAEVVYSVMGLGMGIKFLHTDTEQ